MAKKSSMPDFTFALGADLREAAAKMRKMRQPPKHQSDEAIDAMSGDAESTVESPVADPPIAEEEITPEPNPDAPICEEPPQAEPCASAVAGPSEENLAPADSACAAEDSGLQPLEGAGSTPSQTAGQGTAEPSELPAASEMEIPLPATVEKAEPFQSPSPEPHPASGEVFNAACTSDADPAYPRSASRDEPSAAQIQAAQDSPDCTETSMSVDDSLIQKTTNTDSQKQSVLRQSTIPLPKGTNCHQLSYNYHNQPSTDTVTDTSQAICQAPSAHTDPVRQPEDIASHAADTQASHSQSQTVTDYQFYATTGMESLYPDGQSPLLAEPFQSKTVVSPNAVAARPVSQNDSFKSSQTVISAAIPHEHPDSSFHSEQIKHTSTQSAVPQGISPSIAAATLQNAHLGGARQILLDALTALRQQSPQVVVNLKRLAPAIGLSYGTVRNTISRLVREGVICTTQVRTGDAHGVCVEFIDDNPLPTMTVPSRIKQSTTYQQQSQTVTNTTTPEAAPALPLDDTCIWNTDGDFIAILWPFAAAAGFGPAHLAQLKRAYQLQGWEPENVPRCLRYLDWELANGVSSGPEHVTLWLRIMQRQGHYPRPEGYVDPEVQRLRQKAEEERELAEARSLFK